MSGKHDGMFVRHLRRFQYLSIGHVSPLNFFLYSYLHLISNQFRSVSLCIFAKGLQCGGELFMMPSELAVPLILFREMTS